LLRHSVFFPQKDEDSLFRSNLQTVLAEVTGQFSVDCGGNFTIQDGKNQPDVKVNCSIMKLLFKQLCKESHFYDKSYLQAQKNIKCL